eukprot:TRINITY_DN7797_c0_g1_i1.p1 TRINITY_DN7797_c0_g1~~TRINITY_DN7797_c0_g1_i1.p1  ORF type:complete len:367 (+),score=138.03 TRINITY_DN7797_c0_g1_i1:109-1101(+)
MPAPIAPTAGNSDADKKAVATWIAYAEKDIGTGKSAADLATQLAHLNKSIQPLVYFVNNQFTTADVALYKALHPVLRAADQKTREANFNLCRWFDHIQHTVQDSGLEIVKFKRDIAPQNAGAGGAGGAVNAKAAKKQAKKAEKAAAKAAKKAANKDKPKAPEAPAQPDVSKLDIRVGHINKAWKHPDADSLYVEEIDCGDEKPRQVVSGLVKFIPEDQMQNRTVLVLCNLKPSKMRGVESAAMVLCATSPDGATVEFVEPPAGVKPGDRVSFPGQDGEPLPELPKKQKIWEKVQPDFNTNEEGVACWKDVPFTTAAGVCKAKTVVKGTIK